MITLNYQNNFIESKNVLKVVTICSGIDTAQTALQKLGINYDLVDSVEIDFKKVAMANALHRQFNQKQILPQDIRIWLKQKTDKYKDRDIDILIYTAPCKEYSGAGNGTGGKKQEINGSNLILYLPETIIKCNYPKQILIENVEGTENKSIESALKYGLYGTTKFTNAFINNLSNLKTEMCLYEYVLQYVANQFGYNLYKYVLNASDYGVPQNRKRIIYALIRKDILYMYNLTNNASIDFPHINKQFTIRDILEIDETQIPDNVYYSDYDVTMVEDKQYGGHGGYIINDIDNGVFNTILANCYKLRGNAPVITDLFGKKRTLTTKEMWKAMGLEEIDYERARNAITPYKLKGKTIMITDENLREAAGDAVVPQVWEAMFKTLLKPIVAFNTTKYIKLDPKYNKKFLF